MAEDLLTHQNLPRRKSPAGPVLVVKKNSVSSKQKRLSDSSRSSSQVPSFSLTGFHLPVVTNAIEKEDHVMEGPINITSTISASKELLCVQYTEDKRYVAVGFLDGLVHLYNDESRTLAHEIYDQEIKVNRSPVTAIKYRPLARIREPADSLTSTYVNGFVKSFNYNLQKNIYTIHEKRQTLGLAYHTRLPKFITFGGDARLYLYDEETRTQERIFAASESAGVMDGHSSRIFASCFHPRSNYELISGGWDDSVQFWDVRMARSVRHIIGPHICGDGLEISKSGKEVLTCSWRKSDQIQIWDYGSGKIINTIQPDIYPSMLYCGKFFAKNYIICGGADPNLIRLIDLRTYLTQSVLRGLPGGVYSLDIGSIKSKGKKDSPKKPLDLGLPRVSFCSAKSLYEIEFVL